MLNNKTKTYDTLIKSRDVYKDTSVKCVSKLWLYGLIKYARIDSVSSLGIFKYPLYTRIGNKVGFFNGKVIF